jgi:hypothetical protein
MWRFLGALGDRSVGQGGVLALARLSSVGGLAGIARSRPRRKGQFVGPPTLTFPTCIPTLCARGNSEKEMALIPATIRSLWGPNPVRPSERSHIHRG